MELPHLQRGGRSELDKASERHQTLAEASDWRDVASSTTNPSLGALWVTADPKLWSDGGGEDSVGLYVLIVPKLAPSVSLRVWFRGFVGLKFLSNEWHHPGPV